MSRLVRFSLLACLLFGLLLGGIPARPAEAQFSLCAPDGTQSSGALYRICVPPGRLWNGDLIVYAHGYVRPGLPLSLPDDALGQGLSLSSAVNALGYAYATTSYSTNGLAVKQGLADLLDLVAIFKARHGNPRQVYLVGASEGGLITTLAVEQHPTVFNAGMALCGPIGDFPRQVDYIGDFRVVFDYFFPRLLPGSATSIPQSLVDGWDQHFATVVRPALEDPANAGRLRQLFAVTGAASDLARFVPSAIETAETLLGYNVRGAQDLFNKVGGQPYDNSARVYAGSDDDAALNAGVGRHRADQAARDELRSYNTSGLLSAPLATMHTSDDPLVPAWHQELYAAKAAAQGRFSWHRPLSVARYGHCNFQLSELQPALELLEQALANPPQPAGIFADPSIAQVWSRTDKPIVDGQASRSWVWGPALNAGAWEPYNDGWRLVQYFDKSRMEINNPAGDRGSQWFVTNGLLVQELIDGRLQRGDSAFEQRAPADEPLAGDPRAANPEAPGYAALRGWLGRAPNRVGASSGEQLLRDGGVVAITAPAQLPNAVYIEETGHNIPGVLWDFMNQRGPIWTGSGYRDEPLVDWLFAFGYPISEPYWMRARIGGVDRWVLAQAFQRRVLTYTPDNAPAWRIEMGNVGQHYRRWRYGG